MTITLLLALAAFVLTVASAAGKVSLWPAVLVLSLLALIPYLPLR